MHTGKSKICSKYFTVYKSSNVLQNAIILRVVHFEFQRARCALTTRLARDPDPNFYRFLYGLSCSWDLWNFEKFIN